jgi:tripeptidyl-peptidase I
VQNIPMVIQGMMIQTGGTSASAPEAAGIFAMLNDHRLNAGLPPLGFVLPRMYSSAAAHPGELFYDMSAGNSNCGSDGFCCSTGFPAAVGFDATTGLGSPLWPGLLAHLGSSP